MNQQNDFNNSNSEENIDLGLESLNFVDNNITDTFVIEEPNDPVVLMKKKKTKKVIFWILIACLSLVFLSIITFYILIQIGKGSLLSTENMEFNPGGAISDLQIEDDGKIIEHNGKKYSYNENITAILCIGVDKRNITDIAGVRGNNGQADAVFLYAVDTSTGQSTVIPVSRDVMVDVDMYSGDGNYISSSQKQLCLAFAYGDGMHASCENTVRSVSRLFYGLPINSYVAIDMQAIEVLSEKVGGVPVVPDEDFSYGGFNYYKGQEVLLTGRKAVVYVQGRDQKVLDSNLDRMARQKKFISSFFSKSLAKTKENITFPVSVYNTTKKFMVTDIDVAEVSFLASCVVKNSIELQYKSINGNVVMGEKHAEYYADDKSVYNAVLEVFYKPVS